MKAMESAQLRYDNLEPAIPWIETAQGLEYLEGGIRALLLGDDTDTVKAADFIREFSIERNEIDGTDTRFTLDWALARGYCPPRYRQLARDVAKRLLYDKRSEAEPRLSWLVRCL